jgi:hypothetical protein
VLPYLLAAAIASAPAWIVRHPPLTDLPSHAAAIRVLHSLHDPYYGMGDLFVLTLSRTQYLLYYVVGSLLSYVFGIAGANVILISSYLSGTVLAMRQLLLALGRDPRLCLFTIPLLPNVLFALGLLPFLLGIPLMFWGIAVARRGFEQASTLREVTVGLIALALFFTHIVPFAIFALGFAGLFPWRAAGRVRRAAPVMPAALLSLGWLAFSHVGQISATALHPGGRARSMSAALADAPNWLVDIFRDESDTAVLVAAVTVAGLGLALGWEGRIRAASTAAHYLFVPLVCINAYFILPEGTDFVWAISQRFLVVAAWTAIPLLCMPGGRTGVVLTAAIAGIGLWSIANVCAHFIAFEQDEVGNFEGALSVIPPGEKVCALMFEYSSVTMRHWSFLHFGDYYQVEKGGLVMFTFAGYPHWPFDFKPGHGPPGGPAALGWEWKPTDVSVEHEIYPYYDYVLVRGTGFHPPPEMFRLSWSDRPWQVWQRTTPTVPTTTTE